MLVDDGKGYNLLPPLADAIVCRINPSRGIKIVGVEVVARGSNDSRTSRHDQVWICKPEPIVQEVAPARR